LSPTLANPIRISLRSSPISTRSSAPSEPISCRSSAHAPSGVDALVMLVLGE
jgi:hypothetical protein